MDGAAADPGAAARARSLAALRGMSSPQYVLNSTGGALAASIVFSPVVASFAFVSGILSERYFNRDGQARGHTFASLSRAGAIAGFKTTARVAGWVVGTTAIAASLREGLRMGPRYNDPAELAATSPLSHFAVNAVAGGIAARAVVGGSRPLVVLVSLAGGVLLPESIAQTSAYTRSMLRRLVGQISGGG